jgi:hypothetical protein
VCLERLEGLEFHPALQEPQSQEQVVAAAAVIMPLAVQRLQVVVQVGMPPQV